MSTSHIEYSIYIDDALPATNDSTGFEALTWVLANGVQQLPQIGISHALIEVPDLLTGFTTAVKGAASGIDSQMTFRYVASDTGQGMLKTQGEDDTGNLSVKIVVKGSGTSGAPATGDVVIYAQGIAHSYAETAGNTTTHRGFNVNFRQNAVGIIAAEPA